MESIIISNRTDDLLYNNLVDKSFNNEKKDLDNLYSQFINNYKQKNSFIDYTQDTNKIKYFNKCDLPLSPPHVYPSPKSSNNSISEDNTTMITSNTFQTSRNPTLHSSVTSNTLGYSTPNLNQDALYVNEMPVTSTIVTNTDINSFNAVSSRPSIHYGLEESNHVSALARTRPTTTQPIVSSGNPTNSMKAGFIRVPTNDNSNGNVMNYYNLGNSNTSQKLNNYNYFYDINQSQFNRSSLDSNQGNINNLIMNGTPSGLSNSTMLPKSTSSLLSMNSSIMRHHSTPIIKSTENPSNTIFSSITIPNRDYNYGNYSMTNATTNSILSNNMLTTSTLSPNIAFTAEPVSDPNLDTTSNNANLKSVEAMIESNQLSLEELRKLTNMIAKSNNEIYLQTQAKVRSVIASEDPTNLYSNMAIPNTVAPSTHDVVYPVSSNSIQIPEEHGQMNNPVPSSTTTTSEMPSSTTNSDTNKTEMPMYISPSALDYNVTGASVTESKVISNNIFTNENINLELTQQKQAVGVSTNINDGETHDNKVKDSSNNSNGNSNSNSNNNSHNNNNNSNSNSNEGEKSLDEQKKDEQDKDNKATTPVRTKRRYKKKE